MTARIVRETVLVGLRLGGFPPFTLRSDAGTAALHQMPGSPAPRAPVRSAPWSSACALVDQTARDEKYIF